MSKKIESVASIFLDQIDAVKDELKVVKQLKESWGSHQETLLNLEECFTNEGY